MERSPTAFWSGETLEERLSDLIEPFTEARIDCSAYTLSIGREVYVSPNEQTTDPTSVSIRQLGTDEAFTIPPGQFAVLLTDEIIQVPSDAMAWISMKAKIKWRGLVNVSGFHVDPGFKGRLVFTVFNAGPVPVHLRQGQAAFLIWYVGLDRVSAKIKNDPVQTNIPSDIITSISGELQSFSGLSKRIKDTEKALTDRVHSIEREQTYYRVIGGIVVAVIIAMVVTWLKEGGPSRLSYSLPISEPPSASASSLPTFSPPPQLPSSAQAPPAAQPQASP